MTRSSTLYQNYQSLYRLLGLLNLGLNVTHLVAVMCGYKYTVIYHIDDNICSNITEWESVVN